MTSLCVRQEPEKSWLKINWKSPQEGARLAKQLSKPIFLEMVVGRMGNTNSAVC